MFLGKTWRTVPSLELLPVILIRKPSLLVSKSGKTGMAMHNGTITRRIPPPVMPGMSLLVGVVPLLMPLLVTVTMPCPCRFLGIRLK